MNLSKRILKSLGQGVLVASVVILTACSSSKTNEQSKFASWIPGMKREAKTASPAANPPSQQEQSGASPAYRSPNDGFSATQNNAQMPVPAFGSSVDLQTEMARADNFYRSGALAQAEQAYRIVLSVDPRQAVAHYRLGNIAFRRGQHLQAAQYFQRTVELAPQNAKAHYNLGVVYLILVEQHFNQYRATIPGGGDSAKLSKLLQDIDAFANQRGTAPGSQSRQKSRDSLDALADALE